jgi:hypothetical protein
MTDRDDAEFEQLLLLKFEYGADVDAELVAFHARRHQEAAQEAAEFEDVVGPIRGEFVTGTQIVYRGASTIEERLAAHADSKLWVDSRTGTMTGGNLDHDKPPGSHPGYL